MLIAILIFVGCANQEKSPVGTADAADAGSDTVVASVDSSAEISSTESSSSQPLSAIRSTTKNQIPAEAGNTEGQVAEDELPFFGKRTDGVRNEDYADRMEHEPQPETHTIEIPASWKRLSQEQEIWIDFENKQVIAGGYICQTAAPLEVFVCPAGSKEHESVIAVRALSSQVHAGLLALGAEPGHPVQWHDEYRPASGPVIDITVIWNSEEGIVKRRGQELVRNVRTQESMDQNWVFGGSITHIDEESGESHYLGDYGELVCVSNFSTATMDVPILSSDANDGLLFEANTPAIPDLGTRVYVVFRPILEAGE